MYGPSTMPSLKSFSITLLLCIFLGTFGAHRLYVGRHDSVALTALTGGGFLIVGMVDLATIMMSNFRDRCNCPLQPLVP